MSNTSIRPVPTLRGMFSVPRVTQGRNFLKENKQSLRSLEKTTTEKLAAKEPVRPKWMPPLNRASSDDLQSKSSLHEVPRAAVTERRSKQHLPPARRHKSLSRSSSQQHMAVPQRGEHFNGLEQRQPLLYEPAANQKQRRELPRFGSNCNEPQRYELQRQRAQNDERTLPKSKSEDRVLEGSRSQISNCQIKRCPSCGTNRSSTSIGIQTDDINDELYLTKALKKCSLDTGSMANINLGPRYDADNVILYDDEEPPLSARTNGSVFTKRSYNMDEHEIMPLPQLHGLCGADEDALDDDAPLSGRSRATMASNVSNKSKRREGKLGSREDVNLPRYLEKAKRDKAEALLRVQEHDPDCPPGHVLLTEKERLEELSQAQKHFDSLIHEINHMPMTAQTLRVRTRKAEIDKELGKVENQIRIYSKSKVYVLAPQ